MKECSYCGHRNNDAATVCEECGTAFPVAELTDPKLTDPAESLVILKTFDDVPQASLLKDRLEQAGIEACIPEELGPSPFSIVKPLARVTVRVAQKDIEAAREVLGPES
jgi:Putative prokaryotic signal transducing protein